MNAKHIALKIHHLEYIYDKCDEIPIRYDNYRTHSGEGEGASLIPGDNTTPKRIIITK